MVTQYIKARKLGPSPSSRTLNKNSDRFARSFYLLACFLTLSILAAPKYALGDGFRYIIVIDENCNVQFPYTKSGGKASDFRCNRKVKPPTYTYKSDTKVYVWPGDVLLREADGSISDLIRFPDSGKKNRGAMSVVFYSEVAEDNKVEKDLADVGIPTDRLARSVTLDERQLGKITIQLKNAKVNLNLTGKVGAIYNAKNAPKNQPHKAVPGGSTSDGYVYVFISEVDKIVSKGKSVSYDAFTSLLSFSNDFITETGYDSDPLVGAQVNMPIFHLQGTSSDGTTFFTPLPGSMFSLGFGLDTYLKATPSVLTYQPSDNLFSVQLSNIVLSGADPLSPFFDPDLASLESPFLQYLDHFLDPSSPDFNSLLTLSATYSPDDDFLVKTSGFTIPAESSITNLIFISQVPEPATWILLVTGCAGMLVYCWQRRSPQIK